jgi:hypothetical protein
MEVSGENKTRHYFNPTGISNLEDIKVAISWANGSSSYNCPIREIEINGHYGENG